MGDGGERKPIHALIFLDHSRLAFTQMLNGTQGSRWKSYIEGHFQFWAWTLLLGREEEILGKTCSFYSNLRWLGLPHVERTA